MELISVSDKLLHSSWRQFVIAKVKKPLMMALILASKTVKRIPAPAIILAAKLLPIRPRFGNCRLVRTHNMIEIFKEFWENYDNDSRKELWEAFEILSLAEIEHDKEYSQIAEWFISKMVERVNDGRWPLENLPDPKFWKGAR